MYLLVNTLNKLVPYMRHAGLSIIYRRSLPVILIMRFEDDSDCSQLLELYKTLR